MVAQHGSESVTVTCPNGYAVGGPTGTTDAPAGVVARRFRPLSFVGAGLSGGVVFLIERKYVRNMTLSGEGRRPSLAPEDVARLRMAVPENPMVITAALVLERPLARETLATLVETRLLRHERFRRRIIEPRWGSPRWVDVPEFDLDAHCVWHTAPAGTRTLEAFVADRMNEPLDRDRPLWRLDTLEGVEGGAALVFRVHHVIADGEALVAILGGLADEWSATDAIPSRAGGMRTRGRLPRLLGGIAGAARLALRPPDPTFSRHRALGTIKRVAYSAPLSLAHTEASARAARATVTEMLLAAVAAALRERLAPAAHLHDMTVHALVPVRLHHAAHGDRGNDYASVFVELPLADLAPDELVRRIGGSLRVARSRGAVRAGAQLVAAAGTIGGGIERKAVSFFSRRASVVVSSVRGPSKHVHLGGTLLRDVLVWAPAPGSVRLSVTLMSYAGRIRIGVSADALGIGDPALIVDALERELGAPAQRA